MTYFANESAQIELTNIAGPADLVYGGDVPISDVRLTKTYDSNVRAGGSRVAVTSVTAVWTPSCPYTSEATHTFGSGTGTVTAQSTRCRLSGQAPMRQDDVGTCAGVWNLSASPYTPMACACTMSVSNAGQNRARGL
jgi:hypothetical protein